MVEGDEGEGGPKRDSSCPPPPSPIKGGGHYWGDLKIFFVNLSRPYNFGLIGNKNRLP